MVMCTRTLGRQRLCGSCATCLEFALLGLARGHVTPDLDDDELLTHPRVEGMGGRCPVWTCTAEVGAVA